MPGCIIITGQILVGVIATLALDGNLYTATAHSWMWSTRIRHTAFGANWGNLNSRERGLTGTGQKWWPNKQFVIELREVFYILPVALYWHWHRLPPAVYQNGRNGRLIPLNWWAVCMAFRLLLIKTFWITIKKLLIHKTLISFQAKLKFCKWTIYN